MDICPHVIRTIEDWASAKVIEPTTRISTKINRVKLQTLSEDSPREKSTEPVTPMNKSSFRTRNSSLANKDNYLHPPEITINPNGYPIRAVS